MTRPLLEDSRVHPSVRDRLAQFHPEVIAEVAAAVQREAVVVVGMRQNPFPRKARRLLDAAGVRHTYLEYGSYFSGWKPRLALKMWAGWPTFPMIFVQGQLIGGADDLARFDLKALAGGRLQAVAGA